MKKYCLIFMLVCLGGISTARSGICGNNVTQFHNTENEHFKPIVDTSSSLKIGDKVPDLIIKNIINYPKTEIRISDFKGKVLILDFWSSWCSGCVEFLPKVDSLNKTLKGKAFILPVTYQSETVIQKFLSGNGFLKDFKITSVVADVALKKLFPFNQYPHEVWIDSAGKVAAITYADYVTKDNILNVLNGKTPEWAIKKDKIDFKISQPLLFSSTVLNSSANPILFGSTITGHYPGVAKAFYFVVDSAKKTARYTFINERLLDLYAQNLNSSLPLTSARRILLVKHKSDYDFYSDSSHFQNWESLHTYSYECILPQKLNEQVAVANFLTNLELVLHLKGEIVEKNLDCWVLQKLDNGKDLHSQFTKKNYPEGHRPLNLQFVKTSDLVYILSQQENIPPVFDGIQSAPRFDLQMKSWPQSLDEWNKALIPIGLKLEIQHRKVDMFQLTELPQSAGVVAE